MDALGHLAIAVGGPQAEGATGRIARECARGVQEVWRKLREVARGEVGEPPLRAFVNHYPRKDLPGRCVTVQTVFYTVPDVWIEQDRGRAFALIERLHRNEQVEGRLFEVRQTWRLDGKKPRLIGALLEATRALRRAVPRHIEKPDLPQPAGRFLVDSVCGAHFPMHGGGDRFGFLWYDAKLGAGPADARYTAFRIDPERNLRFAPLPAAAAGPMLAFVRRA